MFGVGVPGHGALMSYERGGMERNEGRNERSGVQDKRAARTQEGGGKSVTNCEAQRSTFGNAAATMPYKFLDGILLLLHWFGASFFIDD